MKHVFFLSPTGSGVGLTSVSLGMVRALDQRGVRVAFCKPIAQSDDANAPEQSTHFIEATSAMKPAKPISLAHASSRIAEGKTEELMKEVVQVFQSSVQGADVVVVEGLVPTADVSNAAMLNREVVQTLSAEVILVASMANISATHMRPAIESSARLYGSDHVIGCIVNRVPISYALERVSICERLRNDCPIFTEKNYHLIGAIPENDTLTYCRTLDIARALDAEILFPGGIERRRVSSFHVLARTIPNLLHTLRAGAALICPTDRDDILLATAVATMNKVPMSALILTGDTGMAPNKAVLELCRPAFESGLPVLRVAYSTWVTAVKLQAMDPEVPIDDIERMQKTMDFVAENLDGEALLERCSGDYEIHLSPAAFLHKITEAARATKRRILLPEGNEPRTIRAACLSHERGIADCVLLAPRDEVERVAASMDIQLPDSLEILNPEEIRGDYVEPLYRFRKHKGLSKQAASDQLTDNVVLGTVMLALGEADGLVSGAEHSSANTVRPALQLIKTRPNCKAVSSIFFMCLPEQVVVYGDCAVVTDPDAETLADIAIQAADSSEAFGIPARVAMISYSTGESGSGADVDKVREATRLAKERRPDLLIDGPLQYDAAAIPDVAAKKAPNSPVAGKATVFIFPDLNTGNTTYKAVQRSANVLSIGPMLQGLKRPVNDLSRGALVEDIVYTIAITAIQAEQNVAIELPAE